MKRTSLAMATLLIAAMATMVFADDGKKKPETKGNAKTTTNDDAKATTKGEKPKASPGWVIVEEDWYYPFLGDFSAALHKAREHYRSREEKSASAEIDKAVSWLKYAESYADKSTAEDLSTARFDLMDFSSDLKRGKPIQAKKLDAAFAHASVALSRHHHFRSDKALAKGDLKTAARYLMAATDLLRHAAQSANIEYGSELVDIENDYAPFGYWNDAVVLEKSELEANLNTVKAELEKLAAKLKASR